MTAGVLAVVEAPLGGSSARGLGPIEALDRFMGWVASTGLELYPAQEEGLLALAEQKHLILNTPTGSGKSLVASFALYLALCQQQRAYYTCPIKALVNEKFFELCRLFGPDEVGLMTGDATVNRNAPLIVCTAEILSNMAVREARLAAGYVVMDEFHYYADRERGVAWQIPLLLLDRTLFVLMSATLGDTRTIAEGLEGLTGRAVAQVRSAERPVPLEFTYAEDPLHETLAALVKSGRAPVYVVNFTQRAAAEQAQNLMSVDLLPREDKEALRRALEGVRFDTPYGKDMQRFLRHGVGLHHAGLLPKYRLLVEKLAREGILKIISGTDTLGLGINVPIRTVLLTQLCKYDGEKTALLTARELHQIAGRAGRKGFDERGYVVAQAPEHVIENRRLELKKQAGRKVVKRSAPERGYVHWDKSTFERLVAREPEPLESRFEVSFGLLLSLIQSEVAVKGGGYGRLVDLISRSRGSAALKRRHRRLAAQRFRTLRQAGIIVVHRIEGYGGAYVRVAKDLQHDFSLFHTLSLYLLESLSLLDPASPTYGLDVLTQVESILENPEAILFRQLDRLKGEKVAELKAQGVEYEDRMAELEKLEYPKPNRDFVYATFNAFAEKHPWVGAENIRPKSIARDIVEHLTTFNDYIIDYGLERMEGLLLRYLTESYKTLVQSVPERFKDDAVLDVIQYLRSLVRGVDSSLIDEWERLRDPDAPLVPADTPAPPPKPREIAQDPRAFLARIRNDLHRLLRALASRNWQEAAGTIYQRETDWPPERIAKELEPYFAEHARIDTTPSARQPRHTLVKQLAPRQWQALQKIVDESGEADWVVECRIDLAEPRPEDLPLIELVRVGT
jgi:superfamily II RNA helicase